MTPSRFVILASIVFAICIVAALGMFAIGPLGLGEGGDAALSDARLGSSSVMEDLQARLAALEEETRRLRTGRGAALDGGSSEAVDDEPESEEADGEILAARVTELETRLRSIETQLRALSTDPVSRGFEYISSTNPDLRRRGIDMLRRLARSDPQALASIRNLLGDPDSEVREEALEALEDVNDRESIPRILGLVEDQDAEVREAAIESLAELLEDADPNDPQVLAAAASIGERLADENPEIRRRAADALGEFQGEAAVPALLQSLEDPDDDVREEAITSLADLEAAAALPRLRAMYDGDPGEHRMDLVMALRRLGDTAPFEKEVAQLSQIATASADEGERQQAIRQLGRFEASELRDVFVKALEDPSPRVRREAEEALEEIDEERRDWRERGGR